MKLRKINYKKKQRSREKQLAFQKGGQKREEREREVGGDGREEEKEGGMGHMFPLTAASPCHQHLCPG